MQVCRMWECATRIISMWECVMSHMDPSCDMTHFRMRHDSLTHMSESCHIWIPVWLDPFICVMSQRRECHTCICVYYSSIHMCDMTHSRLRHDSFTCMAHDSFKSVTRLIHVCRDSLIHVSWLIHICDLTHPFTRVTWLIHSHVGQDSSAPTTLLIHLCHVTHTRVSCHTYICIFSHPTYLHLGCQRVLCVFCTISCVHSHTLHSSCHT